MNIVNLLGFIWMMLTWSILKMVTLPEDKLMSLRTKKTKKDLSNHMLKSVDSFNDNSVMNVKLNTMSDFNPEKVD